MSRKFFPAHFELFLEIFMVKEINVWYNNEESGNHACMN